MLKSTFKTAVMLLILLPTTTVASDFYVGISFTMISRSGLVVGYSVDDENSLEVHFGGLPHNATFGVSLKHSNRSKEYLVFGYSALSQWPGVDGERLTQGLQLGVGRRIDSISGDWSQSFEVVGGPGYDFQSEQWNRLISIGIVSTYKELDQCWPWKRSVLVISRKNEFSADAYGVKLLKNSNRNPRALITAFEKMSKVHGDGGGIFASHPGSPARIEAIENLVSGVQQLATLIFVPHLEWGIVKGVVLSLLFYIYKTMQPHLQTDTILIWAAPLLVSEAF